MNKQKKLIFASAIAALAISGTAGANVIYGTTATNDGGVPTSDVPGAQVINFNPSGIGCGSTGITCTGDYAIITPPPTDGKSSAPGIGGGAKDPTNYLTVPSNNSTGSATISLGSSGNHYFGLLWGSIDAYNTLTFLLDDGTNLSYTGASINDPATGNQTDEASNKYVNFFQLPAFHAVQFSSKGYAFESDNLAYSDVPEPGNLVLFGLGALALLVGFRGRFSGRAS